jgi:capsule polysaccharide export protein KpsE/RkpR
VSNTPQPWADLSFLRSRAVMGRVAAVTLACAAAGGLYGLLAPKWYRSVLGVVPAKGQKAGGISTLLGSDLSALVSGFDSGGGPGAPDVARIAAVLQSVAVSDAVIEKFDLRTRYGETYQENAREALWKRCEVTTQPKPGLVQLSCEDKDPRFVQQLLAYFAEHGNEVFRRISAGSASEEVKFLTARVVELRRQADESAGRMKAFQEKHRIVDLDSQARAVVSSLAELNRQGIAKEMELDYTRRFSAQGEATTRQLEAQLSVVEAKARDLQEPAPGDGQAAEKWDRRRKAASGAMFPPAMAVPSLRAEYEMLLRDRKVAEATLIFGLERLEGAEANQARDVSTFLVLDPPALPTLHARPRRLVVAVVAALLGLVGSLAFAWWRHGGSALVLDLVLPGSPRPRPAGEQARDSTRG